MTINNISISLLSYLVPSDLPNATYIGNNQIDIWGTKEWRKINSLESVFISIISHEEIHATLDKLIDYETALAFDEVGSVISWRGKANYGSKTLSKITLFPHGVIGVKL